MTPCLRNKTWTKSRQINCNKLRVINNVHFRITPVINISLELYVYKIELYADSVELYAYNSSYIHITLLMLQYLAMVNMI